MSFTNGQLVQASDLNNFSVDSVTTSAALSVGTTATVSGLVDVSGASAGQVKFPATQNASTNANTLDDYEEGTWTPIIAGTTSESGQTYTIQVGRYVKIGKLVTAYFYVSASDRGTITGQVQISPLPFTSETTTNQIVPALMAYWNVGAAGTAAASYSGLLAPNSTAIVLYIVAAAGGTAPVVITSANLDTAVTFCGSVTYTATA